MAESQVYSNRYFLETIINEVKDYTEKLKSKIEKIKEDYEELRKIKFLYETALELFCLENPKIGDFWHEMYNPILVVVDVHENQDLTICQETKPVDDKSYTFDLLKSIRISKEEFFKKLKREKFTSMDMNIRIESESAPRRSRVLEYEVIPQRIPSIKEVYTDCLKKSFEN